MTRWDILLAVATLILGWYGRGWVDGFRQRRRRRIARAQEPVGYAGTREWIVEYYIEKGQGDFLHTLDNGKRVPYLTRPEWTWPHTSNNVTFKILPCASDYPIDKRLIDTRKHADQNIWDGPVFLLNGIVHDASKTELIVCRGTYFQYASAASRLSQETRRCLKTPSRTPAFRNKYARTIHNLQNGDLGAQIVGMTVAVVLNLSDGPNVLIQTRSETTGIAAKMQAVVPAFVCDPGSLPAASHDFCFHFFLLEFFEELYNKESLVKNEVHVRQDWFYNKKPITDMLRMYKSGSLRFEVLGFGFDGHTSELNVACACFVDDTKFANAEVSRMQHNWEVEGIKLVPLQRDTIEPKMFSDDMYVTSAYTLSRLLNRLSPVNALS